MSSAARASDPRRRDRLDALGVVTYRLRGAPTPLADSAPVLADQNTAAPSAAAAAPVPCVLLLPAGCSSSEQALIGRAMLAFGADFARAPRLAVPAQGLQRAPPRARAYLAFGEAQARALGQVLTAAEAQDVEVVLLDAPSTLNQGPAKQRLWLALRALRRRLADA